MTQVRLCIAMLTITLALPAKGPDLRVIRQLEVCAAMLAQHPACAVVLRRELLEEPHSFPAVVGAQCPVSLSQVSENGQQALCKHRTRVSQSASNTIGIRNQDDSDD